MGAVYFWDPDKESGLVGHCSLMLSDGTYFSFWPDADYGMTEVLSGISVPSKLNSYDCDCNDKHECKAHDWEIKLKSNLDTKAVKRWWSRNGDNNYSFTNWNCSTMVMASLDYAGYKDRNLEDRMKEWRSNIESLVKSGKVSYKKAKKSEGCSIA